MRLRHQACVDWQREIKYLHTALVHLVECGFCCLCHISHCIVMYDVE